MKTIDLKKIISDKIMEIQDVSILQKINTFVESKAKIKNQFSLLSEDQLAWIKETSNDFKAAYTQTNDEIAREIEEWLSEKILI